MHHRHLRLPRRFRHVVPAFLLAAGVAACGGGSPAARAYVETLGADTMSVETYTRTADRIEGELLTRSPVTQVARYNADLDAEGHIRRFEVSWSVPPENPDGPDPQRIAITIDGDSATIVHEGGQNPGTTTVPAPHGAIPLIGKTPVAFAVFEQAVRQSVAAGGDRYELNLLQSGRPAPVQNTITRRGADVVEMDFFGSPMTARVDPEGRVLSRSGAQTTMKVEGVPTTDVDFEALAAEFAARDARGEGLGIASPRDQVQMNGGGANFEVDYGRPAKRGREIFGGLVPYGEIWRTGANAATHFTTDRDLTVGGTRVPAGTYTLWTTFSADGGELIINRQTQIWGTAHNPEHDFVRVPMNVSSLESPAERFTISIDPTDTGGMLHLAWDATRYSVPLQVR